MGGGCVCGGGVGYILWDSIVLDGWWYGSDVSRIILSMGDDSFIFVMFAVDLFGSW